MKEKHIKHIIAILIAVVIGMIYHMIYLAAIPQGHNCTFIANAYTDAFAIIFGILFVYLGLFEYDSLILTIGGSAIITEHIMQVFYKFELTTNGCVENGCIKMIGF